MNTNDALAARLEKKSNSPASINAETADRLRADRRMLELCLDAFRAGVSAKECRRFLKKRCGKGDHEPYSGSGQELVRREMIGRLEYHLNLERTV